MLPSLILQLMIDVMLMGVVAWLWLQQKKHPASLQKNAVNAPSESRILELERALVDLKSSLEAERRKMQSLHDRILKLIDQGALTNTIFPMSKEEEELKSLPIPSPKSETIPSLKQLELTRERLAQETVVDLRTILRDQLA